MNQETREKVLEKFLERKELGEDLYCLPDFYDAVYQIDADYETKEKLIRENIDEEGRILYLGCGTGNLIELLDEDYIFVGIEPSKPMADKAREKTSAKIVNCGAEEIGFEEEFDAVVSFGQSMNYIREDGKMDSVLRSAFEALKENGVIIFDFMTDLTDFETDMRDHQVTSTQFGVQEKFEKAEGNNFYLTFYYRIEKDGEEVIFEDKDLIRSWDEDLLKDKLGKTGFSSIESLEIYGNGLFHLKAAKKK